MVFGGQGVGGPAGAVCQEVIDWLELTVGAQWLRLSAMTRGFDPGHGGCFSDGGKKRKRPCVELLAHIKDPQLVEINPELFTKARLIAQLYLLER